MEACCCIDRAQIGARHEWHCIARIRRRSADKSSGFGVCGSLAIKLLPPVTFRLRQKSSKTRFKLVDVLAIDFDIEVTKASPETSSSGRFGGSIRPAHRPLAKYPRAWPNDLGVDDATIATLCGDRKLGAGGLIRLRLRVDLEAVGVLGRNPRSDRHRFDGDL